jgi:hypothetical protein
MTKLSFGVLRIFFASTGPISSGVLRVPVETLSYFKRWRGWQFLLSAFALVLLTWFGLGFGLEALDWTIPQH